MCQLNVVSCFKCGNGVRAVVPCNQDWKTQLEHMKELNGDVHYYRDDFHMCLSCLDDPETCNTYLSAIREINELDNKDSYRRNMLTAAGCGQGVLFTAECITSTITSGSFGVSPMSWIAAGMYAVAIVGARAKADRNEAKRENIRWKARARIVNAWRYPAVERYIEMSMKDYQY